MRLLVLVALATLLFAAVPASADEVGVCVGGPAVGQVQQQVPLPDVAGSVYVFANPGGDDPVLVTDEPSACCFDFTQCCMCGVDGAVALRVFA